MHFSVKSGQPEELTGDCAILAWFAHKSLPTGLRALDKACGGVISRAARQRDLGGKAGQVALLQVPGKGPYKRLLIAGCGDKSKFTRSVYRKVTHAAASSIALTGAKNAISFLPEPKGHLSGESLATDTVAAVDAGALSFRLDEVCGQPFSRKHS